MSNQAENTSIADRLLALTARRSGMESLALTLNTPLLELGIDSLGLAELMFDIDDEFGIEMMEEDMLQIKLVSELVTHIENKVSAKELSA